MQKADRAALLRHAPFRAYFCASILSALAGEMMTVAIGWQVYALTGSAAALGMIGLTQFVPTTMLIFYGGHVADRHDRRLIVCVCELIVAAAVAALAIASALHMLAVAWIFAAAVVFGVTAAFQRPAGSALLPGVAPPGALQPATALATSAMHFAMIAGPALGGLVYAIGPGVAYATIATLMLVAGVLFGKIRLAREVTDKPPPTLRELFAGVGFVRRSPTLFGTISLDLFAVLLGGATALMPIYARDILHTGAWGLGVLRGAPAVGALLMTGVLARFPVERHIGLRMFQAVIVFGLATILFALSRDMRLSLAALAVMGAADTVSMVIRIVLVQVATPDDMRGRVGAVNFLFIGASNELGEFESGMTAALFGTVPAAVLGGIGTILVALLWMKLFPRLRDADRIEE